MLTDNQAEFVSYLKNHRNLSASSISKYARQAHNRIYKDLGISFYDLESMEDLHNLLQAVKELEKIMVKDPKRMYSSAVSNYIKFKAYQLETTYLIEESLFAYSTELELVNSTSSKHQSVDKLIKTKPAALKAQSKMIYQRNPVIAAEAIKIHDYTCQVNGKHKYFISESTQRNYVEAHHIVPISTQALFDNGIDCIPNIACLCPVCHRQVHFGLKNDKHKILRTIWDINQRDIKNSGIDIDFKELVELY